MLTSSTTVHPKVIQEIMGLKKNPEKQARLGPELDFILTKVSVSKEYDVPSSSEYDEMDETITFQELALSSNEKSSPSSKADRFFLILAQHNNLKLLTREGTLFILGRMILSIDDTWGISDAIIFAIDNAIATKETIKNGIKKLKEKQETIPERCIKNLKDYNI